MYKLILIRFLLQALGDCFAIWSYARVMPIRKGFFYPWTIYVIAAQSVRSWLYVTMLYTGESQVYTMFSLLFFMVLLLFIWFCLETGGWQKCAISYSLYSFLASLIAAPIAAMICNPHLSSQRLEEFLPYHLLFLITELLSVLVTVPIIKWLQHWYDRWPPVATTIFAVICASFTLGV